MRIGSRYMGLQWANECFCDNEYGKYGSLPGHACDVDDDGEMDCGQWGGDSGDMPDSIPGREALHVCGWKAAVYSIGSEASPELTTIGAGPPQPGLSSNKMALITSDCGTMGSPNMKWP